MKTRLVLTLLFLLGALAVFAPRPAQACCNCENQTERLWEKLWVEGVDLLFFTGTVPKTIERIEGEFTSHKQWLVGMVWEDNILPAMMMMTDELITVGAQQLQIFGTLMDAKMQLETQQAVQIEKAQIHKTYRPSTGLCEIGTGLKSLAASDRRAEITEIVLSQRALDRHLGNAYSSAFTGRDTDRESRLRLFREKYCDKDNNKNGMEPLCQNMTHPHRRDRDIDYVRLIDEPWTLNLDFIDKTLTQNEEDVFAMASTLYGNKIVRRPLAKYIANVPGRALTAVQEAYMDARALFAKRSVAENSFNAIAAMKASGSGGSREYMVNLLGQFGIQIDESLANPASMAKNDAGRMLGDDPADPSNLNPMARVKPSYYAQMEVLTKKMFQNPDFYTNLYDSPANIDRKTVAMQAIGLMQKFDVFKSYLRQEAAVSLLLELAVTQMQNEVENELGQPSQGGIKPVQ